MLNYLETNQYTTFLRRSCLQPLASKKKSAWAWQKAARYCLCYRHSIELLPTQHVIGIVKLALAPSNHPFKAARPLEPRLVTYSTRSLNSK